ncbi:MAG: hypothetical protein ACK5DE_10400 [Bacteroidota bacterium]|jgi:hypothetical protein
MEAFIVGLITYAIGYWYGKRVGVATTMIRVQHLIYELQQIENFWKTKNKQWNEDNL